MKFIENVSKEQYIKFFNSFKYAHFLQSYAWGCAIEETRGKKAKYVGVIDDDGNLIAATLLLEKTLPLGYKYYYASRGYLLDFTNDNLLEYFTSKLKEYMKKNKGIYVKINPEIIYAYLDDKGNRKEVDESALNVYNSLLKLGYNHQGFIKLYENNEPRFSFRRYFKNYKNIEEINNSISKTFMKTVNRSYSYNLKINFDANVDNFFELNKSNAIKDGFIQYSDKFYKALYKYGKEYKNILVVDISINGKELYKKTLDEYTNLKKMMDTKEVSKKQIANANEKIIRLEKDLQIFDNYKNNDEMVICSMINGIANNMMWTMYIGNNKLGEYLFAVNRIYYETIIYCFNNGYKFLDLYGTVGDPTTKYRNLAGLHDYKRKFGDEYVEFIGEFDLINNKILYKLLPLLLSTYRKLHKIIKK